MTRPRDPDLDVRLLQAGRRLLRERGVRGVTIAEVARLAGVGRPTVYRRWPNRGALLFELETNASVPEELPDLGSVRADLLAAVAHLAASVAASDRDVAAEQYAAMIREREFADRVWDRRWRPDREVVHAIWVRGVERGELRPELDGREVINDLVAAVVFRVLILHAAPDPAWVEELVDRTLVGAAPSIRPDR